MLRQLIQQGEESASSFLYEGKCVQMILDDSQTDVWKLVISFELADGETMAKFNDLT